MKILQLWAPYRERGGEEYVVNLVNDLLGKGHQVETCVFELDSLLNKRIGPLLALTSFYWNSESLKVVKAAMDRFKPDIVLSHNIMPAGSYAVYQWLFRQGIPVIYYVHNFRPYSVNGYCWANGKIASGGLKLNFLPEMLHGAWQNSVMRTTWYALALWYSHLAGVWQGIDRWIMISEFVEKTMVASGVPADRAVTLRHPWVRTYEIEPMHPPKEQPVLLFIGRISEEKGIRILLEAWKIVQKSGKDGKLLIAGTGPLVPWLEGECAKIANVSYVGYADLALKNKLLNEAWALVVPSVWWEPLGLVVYESYEKFRPVLAANSGGLAETVNDGVTGWLHEPGDITKLAQHILEAFANPEETLHRGRNGNQWLKDNNHSDLWIRKMEGIFEKCIAEKARQSIPPHRPVASNRTEPLTMVVYLADQNPGHDRSFGISRMSETILSVLGALEDTRIHVISSRSSQQGPDGVDSRLVFPFHTRGKYSRLIVDHLHPLAVGGRYKADIWYYPKGFLPIASQSCRPTVVTIHDTIIQYYRDHYPSWRKNIEYSYWARMLKHTLETADCILTVSQTSRQQILDFMIRHEIATKDVIVTYEPCHYESTPQPVNPEKSHFAIHLASIEPHKRTTHLVKWWISESEKRDLPILQLIGAIPPEAATLVNHSTCVISRPFLRDTELKATLMEARALILSSEIEGFGLPAIEAFYLGTPVCHVSGTSVEEILSVATHKGRFSLDDPSSLVRALDEVMAMTPEEVHECGLMLRQHYSAESVAKKMMEAFKSTSISF